MNYRLMGVVAALASCVVVLFSANANAQSAGSYPEKTVRIIVPFPAGGATDIIARVVGERLSGAWNRPVVIENISGAAGAAGTAQAAKAAPDGYSLLTATGTTTTLLPHLRRNLPYDPLRDFDAVSLLCSFANILVVRPDLPARTVGELIALVRANPGKFTYASSGFGASPHLSAEWFKLMTKTDILHVPYTGSGPALPALLGGHVCRRASCARSARPPRRACRSCRTFRQSPRRSPASTSPPGSASWCRPELRSRFDRKYRPSLRVFCGSPQW